MPKYDRSRWIKRGNEKILHVDIGNSDRDMSQQAAAASQLRQIRPEDVTPAPTGPDWRRVYPKDGQPYWKNLKTGEIIHEKPLTPEQESADLPDDYD